MNTYSMMRTIEKMEDNKYLKLKRYLPKKIYLYYLKKYGKSFIDESVYLGENGDIIMLPFTMSEFEELDENYKKSYIENVIKKHEMKYLYAEPSLSKIIRKIDDNLIQEYSKILIYIMFDQIMNLAIKDNCIDRKEMRLTIIDSGDSKIDYILDLIIHDLNHLTIITQRAEYFKEYVDIIYDNTGLVIEVIAKIFEVESKSDLIIDMSKKRFHYQNGVIIDMESDIVKRQYQYSRKRDTCIIYDIKICSGIQVVDNELLGFFLLRNHPDIQNFLEETNYNLRKNSLQEVSKELDLKLVKLIYI